MIPEDVITLAGLTAAGVWSLRGGAPLLVGLLLAPILLVCADWDFIAVLVVILACLSSNN